jgi:hypothetical protein
MMDWAVTVCLCRGHYRYHYHDQYQHHGRVMYKDEEEEEKKATTKEGKKGDIQLRRRWHGRQRTEDDDKVGADDWRAGQAEWGARTRTRTRAEIRDDGPRDQGAAERTEGALIRRVETHGMAGESGWGWGAWCVLGCWDGWWLALHGLHYEKG